MKIINILVNIEQNTQTKPVKQEITIPKKTTFSDLSIDSSSTARTVETFTTVLPGSDSIDLTTESSTTQFEESRDIEDAKASIPLLSSTKMNSYLITNFELTGRSTAGIDLDFLC